MSLRGAKRRGNPDDNNASGTRIYTGLLRSARNDDGAVNLWTVTTTVTINILICI